MRVDPQKAAGSFEYEANVYFCSKGVVKTSRLSLNDS
jgi:hypothetical protein